MKKLKNTSPFCEFQTERLQIRNKLLQNQDAQSKQAFSEKVMKILTPKVTKSLPNGWQTVDSVEKASAWALDRENESDFLSVNLLTTNELIGFLFLYKSISFENSCKIRFGYLLAENAWGNGLGTELIQGLVKCCKSNKEIKSLSGGVETDNIGSIMVMKKTGFVPSASSSKSDKVIFYEMKFER